MIGIDWGTSSFRAFRLGDDGAVRERRAASRGIMSVADGKFADVVHEFAGDWLKDGETQILLSGMIGSRQGWTESKALPCPASIDDLAQALTPVPFDGAQVFIVPGLFTHDADGVPEFIRGEETQIAGLLPVIGDSGLVCLPGTHSKWVQIESGRIATFTTYMTGEAFAALSKHTILGRLMKGDDVDEAAYLRGVERSADAGGLLHHLFGARTLVLAGEMSETATWSYLSGLLIGHEIRSASTTYPDEVVHLIGEPHLCELYAHTLHIYDCEAVVREEEAAVLGLAHIGGLVQWN